MFEEGNLLLFHPFLFKNGAHPKDKFFLVMGNVDGELLLASVYGADLDMYSFSQFELQERLAQTSIELVGSLAPEMFSELKDCLANSKMVKNRYRRLLEK